MKDLKILTCFLYKYLWTIFTNTKNEWELLDRHPLAPTRLTV